MRRTASRRRAPRDASPSPGAGAGRSRWRVSIVVRVVVITSAFARAFLIKNI